MASNIYKNSFVYILLGFLAPGVNFFLLPIYTKELPTYEFGIITLATLLQFFLANLTGLGLNGAFSRFFFDFENDSKKLNALFTIAFVMQILAGLIVHSLFLVFGDFILSALFNNKIFTYSTYGNYMSTTAIALNLQALVLLWYRNKEDIKSYSTLAIIFFILQAAGIFIGIVVMKKGALGNIGGRMIGCIMPLGVYILSIIRRFYFTKESLGTIKKMLIYGLPLVPYLLINMAYSNIDKVLLERYFTLSILGLYGFAFMIVSITEIFINALQSATYPSLFRELKKENPDEARLRNIYSLFILANLTIVVAIASLSGLMVDVLIDRKYHAVVSYLPLLSLIAIPRAFSIIYGNTLSFYKKTSVMPLASIISLLAALIGGVLFIPLWGVWGAIAAIFISQSLQMFLFLYFNFRLAIMVPQSLKIRREVMLAVLIILSVIMATLGYNYIVNSSVWYLITLLFFGAGIFLMFGDTFDALLSSPFSKLKRKVPKKL